MLTSDLPITGSFANVSSGARLNTSDGLGSFLVSYGSGTTSPNTVVLSDFIAIITTENFAQWTARYELQIGEDGLLDDPNQDGITNIEAYFRGMAPTGNATPNTMELTTDGTTIRATISSPKSVVDIVATSRVSIDLINWSLGPEPTIIGETGTKNIYGVTLPADDRYFVRFEFSELLLKN